MAFVIISSVKESVINMALWVRNSINPKDADTITRYQLVREDPEKCKLLMKKLPNFDFNRFASASNNINLLTLFDDGVSDNFEHANSIILSLADADIDPNTFRYAIERMWPDFATFFIDGNDCIKFQSDFSFGISSVKYAASVLKTINGTLPADVERLLAVEEMAISNAKVLSLGKKVQDKCFPVNIK